MNLQATRKRPKKKKQKYLFSAVASASAGAAGKWWIDGLMDGHEPYLATLRRRDESAVFCRFLSGCSWLAVSFFFFFVWFVFGGVASPLSKLVYIGCGEEPR